MTGLCGTAQRDFADPIAMTSRATIEGLFGIVPDMLAGELRIQPGFQRQWDHASMVPEAHGIAPHQYGPRR